MNTAKTALLALTLIAPMASAASFNCAKAASPAEKLICGDAGLSKLDEDLNAAYARAVARVGDKALMRSWQRAWLGSHALGACKTAACMKPLFAARTRLLDEVVASRWNGQYARHYKGKPDRHTADIVLVAVKDEAVMGTGSAVWMGPNAANGQVNVGEFDAQGSFTGEHLIFETEDCHVSMTLKGNALTVEDSNTCGGNECDVQRGVPAQMTPAKSHSHAEPDYRLGRTGHNRVKHSRAPIWHAECGNGMIVMLALITDDG